MPAVREMSPVRTSEPVPLVATVSSAPSLKPVMMVSPTHVERVMPIVQPLERVPPVATPMSVRNWNNVTTVLLMRAAVVMLTAQAWARVQLVVMVSNAQN